MTGISFYCFLWRLISVRRVRASNGRQNRFFYRSHRNGQSRKNIVFMRLCGVSGIHFLRHGEQIILLFFILRSARLYFDSAAGLCQYFQTIYYHKIKNNSTVFRYFFCHRRNAAAVRFICFGKIRHIFKTAFKSRFGDRIFSA